MRIYETTFILSPQADDAAFDRQIKAVTNVINRYQGRILKENRWGVRRLAYPIKKFTQGYYTHIIFKADKQVLSELERHYRLEEPYIRYLTVLYEGTIEETPPETRKAGESGERASHEKPHVVPVREESDDSGKDESSDFDEEDIGDENSDQSGNEDSEEDRADSETNEE
jgi:small subunit ribosomal protein S6